MDDTMASWRKDWAAVGADPGQIVKMAKRGRLHATLALVSGWLAAATFSGLCGILLLGQDRPEIVAILAFAGTFSVLFMLWTTWRSRSLPATLAATQTEPLTHRARRLELELSFARAWWPLAVVIGALLIWVPWLLTSSWDLWALVPWLAGIVLLVVGAGAAQRIVLWRTQHKLAVVKEMLTQLED